METSCYLSELNKAMTVLADDPRVVFLGQSVSYSGNAIFNTLKHISDARKIELPVFEETQMGLSIGLALEGFVPVTCYPRFDFLLLAVNQLVNHLDKLEELTCGDYRPRVIIRTSVGPTEPLNGGLQHTQNHTAAFMKLLTNVDVVVLDDLRQIVPAYTHALKRSDAKSTLLVELGKHYQ